MPSPTNITVDLKSGNIDAAWARFKQQFQLYLIYEGRTEATPLVKWSLLLKEAGPDALDVYNSFKSKLITKVVGADGTEVITDNSRDYDAVVAEFDAFAKAKKNLYFCGDAFDERNQGPNEPFPRWLTGLQNLIRDCEYGDQAQEDGHLRHRIVRGVYDEEVKEELQGKSDLTLKEVIECCKAAESTQRKKAAKTP
ncbi:hypothetical protein FOCC_FOCC017166 [Frankliniella occidentalis]|nr:hypothetical protein FOCC_FOCC017166 [Frankliniella occidentalis]